MNLKFIIAEPEQAETIARFVNAAYRGDSSRKGWTTEADLLDGQRVDADMVKDMISENGQIVLLAYQKDELVGCVALQACAPTCHLGMLTVKPSLQNRGIGAQLLLEAEKYGRTKNCGEITMDVIAVRSELIDWYFRKGYKLTGEKRPFPYHDRRFGIPLRENLEFLLLSKNL